MHQHLEHKLSGASSEVWCTLKNRAPSLQVNLTNITVLSERKKKKKKKMKKKEAACNNNSSYILYFHL